ncbi:MAG: DUF411 domain-containing protein [Geminicoccaceae bacterium]|nr:DUF411 domain-containing protein [Geminicoccaceae bacterium]
MRAAGFTVDALHDEEALRQLKDEYDVPEALRSCHTATVAGYVLEGHVPASDVERLLAERPEGTGLAVAGMPLGSPGMEMGGRREPFDVVLFGPQGSTLFSRHR